MALFGRWGQVEYIDLLNDDDADGGSSAESISGFVRCKTVQDARQIYDKLTNDPVMQASSGDCKGEPAGSADEAINIRYLTEQEEKERWDIVVASRRKARLIKDRRMVADRERSAAFDNRKAKRKQQKLDRKSQQQQQQPVAEHLRFSDSGDDEKEEYSQQLISGNEEHDTSETRTTQPASTNNSVKRKRTEEDEEEVK
jgi:hypothetical protein